MLKLVENKQNSICSLTRKLAFRRKAKTEVNWNLHSADFETRLFFAGLSDAPNLVLIRLASDSSLEVQQKVLKRRKIEWDVLEQLATSRFAQVRIAVLPKLCHGFMMASHSQQKQFLVKWSQINLRTSAAPVTEIARQALRSPSAAESFVRLTAFIRHAELNLLNSSLLLRAALASDERIVFINHALNVEFQCAQKGVLAPLYCDFWKVFQPTEKLLLIRSIWANTTHATDVFKAIEWISENTMRFETLQRLGLKFPVYNFQTLNISIHEKNDKF